MDGWYREIKRIETAEDITQQHINDAADMRESEYGGRHLTWEEVIYKLETSTEDWGDSMESPAIKHLQKEVKKVLKERTE